MRILLDTNFLLMPQQHGVDIFSEIDRITFEKHSFITLSSVAAEIESLRGNTKDGIAANVAAGLIQKKQVQIMPSEGHADHAITQYAKDNPDVVVATNDKQLKRLLRDQGTRIIHMRGKNHLEYL